MVQPINIWPSPNKCSWTILVILEDILCMSQHVRKDIGVAEARHVTMVSVMNAVGHWVTRRMMIVKMWKRATVHAVIILSCMFFALKTQGNIAVNQLEDDHQAVYEVKSENVDAVESSVEDNKESSQVEFTELEPIQEVKASCPAFAYSREWTEDEQYNLAKIAECEAGTESISTRELVIMVVMNRTVSDAFPDEIEEVITQHQGNIYQFSPVIPGGSWYDTEPSEESYEAVHNVMMAKADTSGGALYFEAFGTEEEAAESWHGKNLEFLYQSDATRFYR